MKVLFFTSLGLKTGHRYPRNYYSDKNFALKDLDITHLTMDHTSLYNFEPKMIGPRAYFKLYHILTHFISLVSF